MLKISEAKNTIRKILSKDSYFIIFILSSLLFFGILYWLTVATVADKSLSIFIMMSGWIYTFSHLFLLLVISILFGIFLSLFVYKIKIMKKASKTGFFGSFGMIIGGFSAGCPMCGSVLFALIGMPLALFYLPFKGLELKVLSIMILSASVYFSALSLNNSKCKL